MATPYSDIYSFFLTKITDFSFANMTQEDLEDQLHDYLLIAISMFDLCKKDLSDRDDAAGQFNVDLSDMEKNILATLMAAEYIRKDLLTTELLAQNFSSKDYNAYSQANHMKEVRETYNLMKTEAERMMIRYSYTNLDISELG